MHFRRRAVRFFMPACRKTRAPPPRTTFRPSFSLVRRQNNRVNTPSDSAKRRARSGQHTMRRRRGSRERRAAYLSDVGHGFRSEKTPRDGTEKLVVVVERVGGPVTTRLLSTTRHAGRHSSLRYPVRTRKVEEKKNGRGSRARGQTEATNVDKKIILYGSRWQCAGSKEGRVVILAPGADYLGAPRNRFKNEQFK